jgi:DNA polymerase III sliding clamp (beta) subunit (PCNA family)
MLKELRFVQGAVSKKDLIPAMTHFRIENGFARSYNGVLALCSPVPFDINCIPKADSLVKAISNCEETITLNMTPSGRLTVRSGKYRSFVECITGETPHVEPAGQRIDFAGEELLKALKILMPFVGNDASRPFTNGVLLKGQSAFATNNVCLMEYWLGIQVPFVVNVPRAAIKEMLRVDEAPVYMQLETNSITFHYTDGRWIRSQLLSTEWPDLARILDHTCNPQPVDPSLFVALDKLGNNADSVNRVYIKDGIARTHIDGSEEGSAYDIEGPQFEGLYSIPMLNLLNGVATHADFWRYPDPTLFYGERLRGAIVGMRM